MAQIRIERVLALPVTLTASTMYIVKSAHTGLVEVYFSNSDGSEALHVIDKNEIAAMIAQGIGSIGSNILVSQTIADRNALVFHATALVLVLDATGDPTVHVGAALYVYDNTVSQYYKVSEFESLDLSLTWNAIQGRPNSTPAEIDAAVANSHTHENKSVLDSFGVDANGLTFNGQPLPVTLSNAEW